MNTFLLLDLLQTIGISIAIGASTFAIIFYYRSIRDGEVDTEEEGFLRTVYYTLRSGMALIVLTQLLFIAWFYTQGALDALLTNAFWAQWVVLAVILINASLMRAGSVSESLGPALAAGSWYYFLVLDALKGLEASLVVWIFYYILFVLLFALFLHIIKIVYVDGFQRSEA